MSKKDNLRFLAPHLFKSAIINIGFKNTKALREMPCLETNIT